ncbi:MULTISPECIES: hypothetical protein [Pseudoalteromonas]|uniref:Uncharacterized protein n=1 Tax=Pseudoalteromonas luteoviolacea (strain 2ta16) TaxID=1353533 RepID=V4HUW6_PSEL2|nr:MULTISPECIES: hypothetical protein [Pseudoalteromonas]ESP94615.1 hypothetical protein PL2TA16_00615 [Pseudoalteromonas luteoviolacea 2ta16]KZN32314.1 hypothetical protein N483_03955 [Pseudoalteromonas luteoviolacea NCIMB 1944]MCG7547550.1 hypothetical protein [Pseudoalteromonas sp. Of7M-16]
MKLVISKKKMKLLSADKNTLENSVTPQIAGGYTNGSGCSGLLFCGTSRCPSQHIECETMIYC